MAEAAFCANLVTGNRTLSKPARVSEGPGPARGPAARGALAEHAPRAGGSAAKAHQGHPRETESVRFESGGWGPRAWLAFKSKDPGLQPRAPGQQIYEC